jgi:hypothetical protein
VVRTCCSNATFLPVLCSFRSGVQPATRAGGARIINGQPVVPGQNPDVTWQVGLLIDNGKYLCGGNVVLGMRCCGMCSFFELAGSIVASDMILTAGHCVKDIQSGTVTDPGLVVATPGLCVCLYTCGAFSCVLQALRSTVGARGRATPCGFIQPTTAASPLKIASILPWSRWLVLLLCPALSRPFHWPHPTVAAANR